MRKLASACFCLAAVLGACKDSVAQNRMSDVPDAFFGAQRGRVVAHPRGGFRMHYGRGLTPQGASVINTGITTLGPLLPGIIGMPGAAVVVPPGAMPMQAPASFMPPAAPTPPAAPSCETESYLPPNQVLDLLGSPENHQQHITTLTNILGRLEPVVKGLGGEYEPGVPVPTSDGETGTEVAPEPLKVRPGGIATPPFALSRPNAAPVPPSQPVPPAQPVPPSQPVLPSQPAPPAPSAEPALLPSAAQPDHSSNGDAKSKTLWTLRIQLQIE